MPKIKKFNLKLSTYQIQQQLKKSNIPITDETISDISIISQDLKRKITPAVFFRNISVADNTFGFEFPKDAVAASIVVSTVGPSADEFVNSYNIPEKSDKYEIAKAVLYQAIEETKKFAWKIIWEEVSEERCILTDKSQITEHEKLNALKDLLAKIDVYPTPDGLVPTYSFVELAYWLPFKKK